MLPYHLAKSELVTASVAPRVREQEVKAFIRSMDQPREGAQEYLETHLDRITRTLTMIPPPGRTKRALELGTYMHMAPTLAGVFGYEEVQGAYYGKLGRTDSNAVTVEGKEIFRCMVDHFDAELDRFPYEDRRFDVVLACEIIEHLLHDPMHMLIEINRVLDEGGAMVLTTPNVASFTAVARVLNRKVHPQVFPKYADPRGEFHSTEIPHVHEYTPDEIAETVEAAGFEVEYFFTEKIAGYDSDLYFRGLLKQLDYPDELRGEQIYCLARKRSAAPITRYPSFLYEGF